MNPPDAVVEVSNPVCGDVLRLSARISGGRIAEIRFQAKGCVSSMACASALTELASGRMLAEAANIRSEHVIEVLGSLPEASGHAAHLAIEALRVLLGKAAQF